MAVSIDSYITLTDAIVVDAGQLVDDSHTERRERAGRAIPGIGRHSMRAATPPYGGRPLSEIPRVNAGAARRPIGGFHFLPPFYRPADSSHRCCAGRHQ
jgi:hypothetical protein